MEGRFWALLPPGGVEPHPGLIDLLLQLEAGGWYPRKLIDGTGLRYNPEHGRHRQVVIDLRYPPNENRLEFLRNHTQLPLELPVNEKGEG